MEDVEKINEELFNIALKLNKFNYFKREFLSFLEIKDMVSYIINNGKLTDINCLIFVENVLRQFQKLLNHKSDNINNLNQYSKFYEEFNEYLASKEEYFYSEIYTPSHKYDEIIVKITNTLE